jgi:hypothetical protein
MLVKIHHLIQNILITKYINSVRAFGLVEDDTALQT